MAIVRINYLSSTLGMQVNVTLCLPTVSFADHMKGNRSDYVDGMKYQTLWLLHGGAGDDSDYVSFTNIARYADENKLAVVMPADYNHWYANDPHGGGRFYDFIVDELPTFLRAYFPLSPKREDNFIGGLSMGGQGVAKCAVLRPDLYSVALIMSGAAQSAESYMNRWKSHNSGIRVGGGGGAVFGAMGDPYTMAGGPEDTFFNARKQAEAGTEMPKFYITAGDKDFARLGAKATYDLFTELGWDTYYEEVPGYGHEWDFWDLTLRKAINENWFPLKRKAIYPGE